MKTKWMVLFLIAIVFHPAFLHAADEKEEKAAAVAAAANAASAKAIDVADKGDDFALEDEDLVADEDLALDEDLDEAPAAPAEKI